MNAFNLSALEQGGNLTTLEEIFMVIYVEAINFNGRAILLLILIILLSWWKHRRK